MFTPHITVACVVHAENKLLVVEEIINGAVTWNQPAGHLEAGESLLAAMRRELLEETGLVVEPQYLLGIHQWTAPDNTAFIRFLFGADLPCCLETQPQDDEISDCHWLLPEQILHSQQLRSPLVAESVRQWQTAERQSLAFLHHFQ